jgi:F420-0:gamma-glutamyl ligase
MKMEQLSISQCLAASAVLAMGEGNEQTPLALMTDVANIEFQNQPPTQKELDDLKIELENDVYAPLLTAVKWKKGGGDEPQT